MRNLRNPRLERGEVRIEDIELDFKSRDDIPVILIGLQYLYSQKAVRDRIFALMDEYILPGVNRKVGRPGMAMWSILVLAVVKQGLGCDFDRLHGWRTSTWLYASCLVMPTPGTKDATTILIDK